MICDWIEEKNKFMEYLHKKEDDEIKEEIKLLMYNNAKHTLEDSITFG